MRKFFLFVILTVALLTSCTNNSQEKSELMSQLDSLKMENQKKEKGVGVVSPRLSQTSGLRIAPSQG